MLEYFDREIKELKEYDDIYNNLIPIFYNKEFYIILDKIINKEIEYNKILIYTDFDNDGISSGMIITNIFDKLNIPYYWKIGNRKDGYGIHNNILENITEDYNCDILITADCGITNKKELEYCIDKLKYKYCFVFDHHTVQYDKISDYEKIYYINNKFQENDDFYVCAAGLCYLVFSKYHNNIAIEVIAGFATIGDMVELHKASINRKLVKNSLRILNNIEDVMFLKKEYNKLYMLLESTIYNFTTKHITEMDFGFGVCPMINALSRFYKETMIKDYLSSPSVKESKSILKDMKDNNENRKYLQTELEKKLLDLTIKENRVNIFIINDADKSLVGLLSSFILNRYNVDNIVLTRYNNFYAGSARSKHCNIYNILKDFNGRYIGMGGHTYAAGLSIDNENIEDLKEYLDSVYVEKIKNSDIIFDIRSDDYDILMSDELSDLLHLLSPFGQRNKSPKFRLFNIKILDIKQVKKHKFCLLEFEENNCFESKLIEGLFFSNYDKQIKKNTKLEYIEGTLTSEKNIIVDNYKIQGG